MTRPGLPSKQGLYDPQFEHDACGVGFIANIKGAKSNGIIQMALTALQNMDHRGAQGSEVNSGDGAGILIQIPHDFFAEQMNRMDISLPAAEMYGVGMVFLPQDETLRKQCEEIFNNIVTAEGQQIIGWRTVPTDNTSLGATAQACEPFVRQVFVGRNPELSDSQQFERKLYVIRRLAEQQIRQSGIEGLGSFYISSLSCRTIVYKGMLTTSQVGDYYLDLQNPKLLSALALFHSRFSTNTFPSWERAHPYRYVIHNGEINTLRGNVNWMHARQAMFESELFGSDLQKVLPIIDQDGSDTAMFDNTFEFLVLAGRSIPHTAMMMIPEPWANHQRMSPEKRAFYEYHSCLMEPWDGPAAMVFSDGRTITATLDRNGLRPARYYITKDDMIILASEAGVLDIPEENIAVKERLRPGRMLVVDLSAQRIVPDEEIKQQIAAEHPYQQWLDEHLVRLDNLPDENRVPKPNHDTVLQRQMAFGYTYEEANKIIKPMATDGVDPVGSMGTDTPLAVLSEKPQLLYNYFKQLFAQVTNPPIDAIREEIVTATATTLGFERNLLKPEPESCRQIEVSSPILTNEEFAKLVHIQRDGYKAQTLPTVFAVADAEQGLKRALDQLFETADKAVEAGVNILVLSDRGVDAEHAPIPALLAVSGLHHHLIRNKTRTKVALVIESGEPREVHHFALLIGYGASAINPYLVFETLDDMIRRGKLEGLNHTKATRKYIKAATKGIVKVISKMGISTIQSYQGSQIFEAIGLSQELVDQYFTWTPSRIEGIGLADIARQSIERHQRAFSNQPGRDKVLDSGGKIQWRKSGEAHLYNPETIHLLQKSCRQGDYKLFKEFTKLLYKTTKTTQTLRSCLVIKDGSHSIPIDEVESVDSIVKRFKTGAMSYGSISKEAHEDLAIAMNRLGGKSNTGEGGEDPSRFLPDENGDLRRSSIKQVASGRFGVTSEYLVNADEIQIKMAQGAKPGEGGQLPGKKVYPWIAEVRHSTPGVGLISPPPHHDIYSIEDLAELIHDLKNANPNARISVKLVAEVGVGTIAAGVAKGKADVILISGYDGGTGAAPETSIHHAGLPWELGLAETHQTLLLNNLRDRVVVETDGKLLSGRDVVIAAMLGAEEFGFATAPLVTLGCVMMRVCHLDTCPTGIATQNPELRKNYSGKPEYVVNFMRFIAQEVRELMADLGIRTISELVGRTDLLDIHPSIKENNKKQIDLSAILYQPQVAEGASHTQRIYQDHGLNNSLDQKELLQAAKPALERKEVVRADFQIQNVNRTVGTILGGEVTKRYGADGLPADTIQFRFKGSAGQSFAAFIPNGMTFLLEGDSNDYFGKGLSGGKIAVYPAEEATFTPEENVIIGNVALYGATSGEAYIRGIAGERFCVRNSGVRAVVEGVGDHGCEYMTGGRVVVLGSTGRNFAAGMSGGIAYILNEHGDVRANCNMELVQLEQLQDEVEIHEVKQMIMNHVRYTNSSRGKYVLENWDEIVSKFMRVMPKDFKRMQEAIEHTKASGLTGADAVLAAFQKNINDVARVSGN